MMTVAIRRTLRFGVVVLVGAFLLIQLIPYGRDHTNPPVVAEPAWDSPATRELAAAACFDCHSNETEWPWYTSVAPISWLTQHDVEEGRATLNFSEWNRPPETGEVSEAIREGSMPPWYYRLLHPAARLSDAELEQLIAGLEATFRASPA
jgi:mono/diheme cytochrome c family protein